MDDKGMNLMVLLYVLLANDYSLIDTLGLMTFSEGLITTCILMFATIAYL